MPTAFITGATSEPGEIAPLCSFRIAGGAPGGKVSWRIEALRNDRYVQKRGMPVEIEKYGAEKGTYQHPELYGQPREKSMSYEGRRDRPEHAGPVPSSPCYADRRRSRSSTPARRGLPERAPPKKTPKDG